MQQTTHTRWGRVMEREVSVAIHTTAAAAAALCCSYSLRRLVHPGVRRLLALIPILYLLILHLPFQFSTFHLSYFAAFLSWLTSFKLLLFAFGLGPLSDPLLPLPSFVILAYLPICTTPKKQRQQHDAMSMVGLPPLLLLPGKAALLAYLVSYYPTRHQYPRFYFISLVTVHLYFALDLTFFTLATVARFLLGGKVVLEPQFRAPYLSSSPREFWGRRWNTPVSRALHGLVYAPVRARLGVGPGVVAAFLVSGLMHEAMFHCATRERQTGVATCYFVLQGLLVAAEIEAKARGWRALPRALATPLTLALVAGPSAVLHFPPLLKGRGEGAAVEESVAALGAAGYVLSYLFGLPSPSPPHRRA